MFGLLRRSEELMEQRRNFIEVKRTPEPAAIAEPPVVPTLPERPGIVSVEASMPEAALLEYATAAKDVGVLVPEVLIEQFKYFMRKHDLPIYNLGAVVKYMDALGKRDNATGFGWSWKPLRSADGQTGIRFGRRARWSEDGGTLTPASDFFSDDVAYDKVVPLHALKRVSMIEKEFGRGPILFAVSDYQTKPHVLPDPFLMAIIPNQRLHEGIGRFVIDVWDEPGFGIEEMVK